MARPLDLLRGLSQPEFSSCLGLLPHLPFSECWELQSRVSLETLAEGLGVEYLGFPLSNSRSSPVSSACAREPRVVVTSHQSTLAEGTWLGFPSLCTSQNTFFGGWEGGSCLSPERKTLLMRGSTLLSGNAASSVPLTHNRGVWHRHWPCLPGCEKQPAISGCLWRERATPIDFRVTTAQW